jgi:hypothetical protein
MVDMGDPHIALGVQHLGSNIQSNWFVHGLTQLGINPNVSFTFPNGWMEREFRYQAIRVNRSVITSMPGEPIHEIGLLLKQDGHNLGFTHVITAGLANGHGSYFTTRAEYGYGGYEGMASMFGPQNGDELMDACRRLMDLVRP